MSILRVLSRRSTPTTAAQIARVSRQGTPAGIRRSVGRLASHGIVVADSVGDRITYALNYEHVLYPAVASLLQAHQELPRLLKRELGAWDPAPAFAALYGSVARGDGDSDSDVDLLLIRPSTPSAPRAAWVEQVHRLRRSVTAWTGNRLHVVDLTMYQFRRLVRQEAAIVDEWRQDLVTLVGAEPVELRNQAS